jgi:hypothetical protein
MRRTLRSNPLSSDVFDVAPCLSDVLGLLALNVFLEDVVGGRLLSPVPDGDGRAPHDLPCVALCVQLAETGPFSQLVVVVDLDESDAVLLAERLHQTLVSGLVAVLGKHAQMGLALVEGLKDKENKKISTVIEVEQGFSLSIMVKHRSTLQLWFKDM